MVDKNVRNKRKFELKVFETWKFIVQALNFLFQMNELCRLCLDSSEMLYKLESDFCILVLDSGDNVTIADAMKYLAMEIKILPEVPEAEKPEEDENISEDENEEPKADPEDDPNLPKVSFASCL